MKELVLKGIIYPRALLLGFPGMSAWCVQWAALRVGADVLGREFSPISAFVCVVVALSLAVGGSEFQLELLGGLSVAAAGNIAWVIVAVINLLTKGHIDGENIHVAYWVVLAGIPVGITCGAFLHYFAPIRRR